MGTALAGEKLARVTGRDTTHAHAACQDQQTARGGGGSSGLSGHLLNISIGDATPQPEASIRCSFDA